MNLVRDKALDAIRLLRKDLTLDQIGHATVEIMAQFIVEFTEEHDRHRLPQVLDNFSKEVEKRVNELLDQKYGGLGNK